MTTKATYLVTDMDFSPSYDDDGNNTDYKTEKAALTAAKALLGTRDGDEVWIWRLSHIVSKPEIEPDVEVVK